MAPLMRPQLHPDHLSTAMRGPVLSQRNPNTAAILPQSLDCNLDEPGVSRVAVFHGACELNRCAPETCECAGEPV